MQRERAGEQKVSTRSVFLSVDSPVLIKRRVTVGRSTEPGHDAVAG